MGVGFVQQPSRVDVKFSMASFSADRLADTVLLVKLTISDSA